MMALADQGGPISRIRFVIPYFGRWPFWMPFFLKSCEKNPTIDWLLITDCGVPEQAPANVTFMEMSFADYCEQVSERLGIRFQPESPYKLCDIKPALGFIHEAQIQGYDFWGFGDIDVVYGDLRAHFTEARLAKKDLYSTHARRISGHLCLIRNNDLMNSAFMKVKDWRQYFENPNHLAVDEKAFSDLFVHHKNWPPSLRSLALRVYFWSRRSEFCETHSTYTLMADASRVVADNWYWRDGRLTNSLMGDRELPYLHFLYWKNNVWSGYSEHELLGPPGLVHENAWEISGQGWSTLPG